MAGFRIETGICNTDLDIPSLLLRVCTENKERILHKIYLSSVAHKFLVTFYMKLMTASFNMSNCSANSHNFHINTFITIFGNII